jgi:hypothetical protein
MTMNTLTINDLSRTEQLDRGAMAAVTGGTAGWNSRAPSFHLGDVRYAPSSDDSIHATQKLMQQQNVLTATANDAAFVDGVHVDSHVSQDGRNKIVG